MLAPCFVKRQKTSLMPDQPLGSNFSPRLGLKAPSIGMTGLYGVSLPAQEPTISHLKQRRDSPAACLRMRPAWVLSRAAFAQLASGAQRKRQLGLTAFRPPFLRPPQLAGQDPGAWRPR